MGLLRLKAAFFISNADLFQLLAKNHITKKKGKKKYIPDWCPRATYESAR